MPLKLNLHAVDQSARFIAGICTYSDKKDTATSK